MSDNVCPTCSDTFPTEAGMKRHHAQIHGESIAKSTSTCKICQSEFEHYSSRDVVVCSQECQSRLVVDLWESSDVMVEPPKQNGGELVSATCETCGDEFSGVPSEVSDQRFCSPKCRGAAFSGHDHPMWDGGKVSVECEWCGGLYQVDPHKEGRTRWCSSDCMSQHLSESMSGENHPRWSGGYQFSYGETWPDQREKALNRDGHACVLCGLDESDSPRSLDVHHKTPARRFDCTEKANQLDNLITLCRSCHGKVERWPVQPLLEGP